MLYPCTNWCEKLFQPLNQLRTAILPKTQCCGVKILAARHLAPTDTSEREQRGCAARTCGHCIRRSIMRPSLQWAYYGTHLPVRPSIPPPTIPFPIPHHHAFVCGTQRAPAVAQQTSCGPARAGRPGERPAEGQTALVGAYAVGPNVT